MKKMYILAIFITLFFTACSPKIYQENKLYGKGINSGYKFDNIDRDRELIYKIEQGNANFFYQKLRYGENKIAEILTSKKNFDIKNKNILEEQMPQNHFDSNDILGDVIRDFKYAN